MTTGERIRLLRIEKGLSQEGLADALDVTRQAVSRWETDGSLPDIDKLIGLCDLFGVSLDYLVRGKEPAANTVQTTTSTPEPTENTAKPHSLSLSRSTIAGILCIILGVYTSPMLIFGFTPLFRIFHLVLILIPVTLLLTGILLLLKRKPSLLYGCWGILLAGALVYTAKTSSILSDMIRGSLAPYPELLYPDWNTYKPLMLVWLLIGLLIIGMMFWTILRYRKTGLTHRRLRGFLLSGGIFSGAILLLVLTADRIIRSISSITISPLWLYLLFWLAILSLTYCITWLLSPPRSAFPPPEPAEIQ